MFRKYWFQNKYIIAVLGIVPLLCSGCASINAPNKRLKHSVYAPEGSIVSDGAYRIGTRDTLEVLVWKCPELKRKVKVRPQDGKITLPLIGDVKAEGVTPKELAQKISKKMAYYVKEPRVAVGVTGFGDKKVFVMGQVLAQGTYRLERQDRIIDVITRAGGFTKDAASSATYIVRGDYFDPEMIRVNVARLLKFGDISQNVYVKEGDIIYVPQNVYGKWNYILEKVFPSFFFVQRLEDLKKTIMTGGLDYREVFRRKW